MFSTQCYNIIKKIIKKCFLIIIRLFFPEPLFPDFSPVKLEVGEVSNYIITIMPRTKRCMCEAELRLLQGKPSMLLSTNNECMCTILTTTPICHLHLIINTVLVSVKFISTFHPKPNS